MLEKLSSDAFSYVVTSEDTAVTIVLTKTVTAESIKFFQADGIHHRLEDHMASLTDEQCNQWFEKKKKGKKKMTKTVIVQIDTEFNGDFELELISIGLACENGDTFYGENLDFDKRKASDWVAENVMTLCDPKNHGMSYVELGNRTYEWFTNLDADEIIVMSDNVADVTLLNKLLGDVHPKVQAFENLYDALTKACMSRAAREPWLFASSLKYMGHKEYHKVFDEYLEQNRLKQHHALADAQANNAGFTAAMQVIMSYAPPTDEEPNV